VVAQIAADADALFRDRTTAALQFTRQQARPAAGIAHRLVFVGDGVEALPRCWHLIMRREVGSHHPTQV
jgi:hypothetical protein